jgi:hypothetical protein
MFYNNYDYNILKSYALTYSRRSAIIALQTSGINPEMDAPNILNKYIKLPSESLVAKQPTYHLRE